MVRKILCLHGGGETPEAFRNQKGMQDLIAAMGTNYEFVFADSPEDGNVWFKDPPGGKGQPTTDQNWANTSINYLSDLIQQQGPFYGILGYSQGVCMTLIMLAYTDFSFGKVILFCGYLPTTHQGIMDKINETKPFSTDTINFIGDQDYSFKELGKQIGREQIINPSNYIEVIGNDTGHGLPLSTHDKFNEVVSFIEETNNRTSITIEPEWNLIVIPETQNIDSSSISKIRALYKFDNNTKTYINMLITQQSSQQSSQQNSQENSQENSQQNSIILEKLTPYWIFMSDSNTENIVLV